MDDRSLRAELPGWVSDLRYFAELGSTNQFALDWAERGAPDGALVVADLQTAGRGRLGRRWITHPGVALAFSLVLHPSAAEEAHLPLFSALAGLGLAEALERNYTLQPQIKWPNDVLLDGRKAAGILVETTWVGQQMGAMIVGVGLNVAPQAVPPALDLLFPATSLEDSLGRPLEREPLLGQILRQIFSWRPRLGSRAFLAAWQERLAFRGQTVSIQQVGAPPLEGVLLGVNAQGNLLLQTKTGVELVVVGDVHLRPLQ